MFPMQISIHNPDQLSAVMSALGLANGTPVLARTIGGETAKEEVKAKPQPESKATPKKESAKKPETVEAQPEPEAPAKQAEAPTYQDTADAVTKLARTKGRNAAVAVLDQFGAAKLPDVKPEQFAALIAECEALGA